MHLKISSGKWRPFCLGLNVLKVKFFVCMFHRAGVEPGQPAVGLAQELLNLPAVTFKGLHCYQGWVGWTSMSLRIDGLVQERRNSSALAMDYVFLALTHGDDFYVQWCRD